MQACSILISNDSNTPVSPTGKGGNFSYTVVSTLLYSVLSQHVSGPKTKRDLQTNFQCLKLNVYVQCPHFRMGRVIRPQDWNCSIDLKAVYLLILIRSALYGYMYLWLAISPAKMYYFRVLTFDLNTTPLLFTRIVEYLITRSDLSVVCPTEHLMDKLQRDLTALSSQTLVTLKKFQSLLGLLNFFAPLVSLGRLHISLTILAHDPLR